MTVIATAGHVDHGKSTLIEALTGIDPDRWAEEKQRGLTIDLGFAHAVLPSGRTVSFVDVPGHSRFLRNMLAGVGSVGGCLFVVDASEGWRPQSEEHLRIIDLLGVDGGVIVVTKSDLVDELALRSVELDVAERVVDTVLAGSEIVAVSTRTGLGLDDLRRAIDRHLDAHAAAADSGRPRLWVDRAFAIAGSGTVVTGTLTGASFGAGDEVLVLPGDHEVRIRGIQVHGEDVDRAGPGERVALNLVGVAVRDVGRGDAVVRPSQWHLTDCIDCTLRVLPAVEHPVTRRGAHVVYIGSGEHTVRLRVLGEHAVDPDVSGRVRLHLPAPLPLLPGDRFVLRESGRDETVGGGEVLDVAPVLPASKAAPDRRWQRVVAERGWVDVAELERLTGERIEPTVDRWVVDASVYETDIEALGRRLELAGADGLRLAELDGRQRALVGRLADVRIDGGIVRATTGADPLADHPVLAQLGDGGMSPPEPDASRDVLRQLRQRGLLVEHDGVWFHPTAIASATEVAAGLLAGDPGGFTVSQFREAAATTRKYALPLLAELDARGITRRRDQVRIAGARLGGHQERSAGEQGTSL